MRIVWLGLESDIGVDALLINKQNYNLQTIIDYQPDIVIEREFNCEEMEWSKEIQDIKKALPSTKTAVWLIDTHVRYNYHQEHAKLFDYVFLAISSFLEQFDCQNKFWLPLCFPHSFIPTKNTQAREHLLGYVGRFNLPFLEVRTAFIEKVKEMYPDFYAITDFATVYETMSNIKLMLNIAYNQDMNYRNFEALACGCGLITSDVPDLHKIDGLVEKISIYHDYDDLKTIVDEKLNEPVIDHSQWVKERHLLKHRVKSMLNMIETNKQESF